LGLGANYLFGQKYTSPPRAVPQAQAGLYAGNPPVIKANPSVAQQNPAVVPVQANPALLPAQPNPVVPVAAPTGAPAPVPVQTAPVVMPPPDHYSVLGVTRNSNSKTIKNSYNRIKNAMSKKNTKQELKQSVNLAYTTLSNSTKRKTYNSSINDWLKKNPPAAPRAN
jgi:hypothetical protein